MYIKARRISEVPLIEHLFSEISKYRVEKISKYQLPPKVKVNGIIEPGETRRHGDVEDSLVTHYNHISKIR